MVRVIRRVSMKSDLERVLDVSFGQSSFGEVGSVGMLEGCWQSFVCCLLC